MNYYSFHIGDYMTHTAHLDPIEDLAYRRLLDLYYLKEVGIPADVQVLARLIRLRGYEDQIAAVLDEFFVLVDGAWRNPRCDAEIDRVAEKSEMARRSGLASAKAKKEKANERSTNAQQSSNESSTANQQQPNVDTQNSAECLAATATPTGTTDRQGCYIRNNTENPKNGQRTFNERSTNAQLPNTQDPIPKTQEGIPPVVPPLSEKPDAPPAAAPPPGANMVTAEPTNPATAPATPKQVRGTRLPPDWALPDPWRDWAMTERQGWTAEHVQRVADKFRDHWIAKPGVGGRKVDWLATWRNWVRDERQATQIRGVQYETHSRTRDQKRDAVNGYLDSELERVYGGMDRCAVR